LILVKEPAPLWARAALAETIQITGIWRVERLGENRSLLEKAKKKWKVAHNFFKKLKKFSDE
jgi:hypothetical protein